MKYGDLPKSRSEAVKTGSRFYFTGEPCIHGHISRRKVNGGCYACWREAWKARNRLLIQLGRAKRQEEATETP